MIVMVEVAPGEFEPIKNLVRNGKYSSIESFIELAIRNQLILEKTQSTKPSGRAMPAAPVEQSQHRFLFEKSPLIVEPVPLSDEKRDSPLWGLINRYAPAKLVLRLLSRSLAESNSEWLEFRSFSEEAVALASSARMRIEKIERKKHVTRGESLAIGLPLRDPRSHQRFVDFHIGRLRADGSIQGLLGGLKLATLRRMPNGTINIGITAAGVAWAKMHSPMADDMLVNETPVESSLSEEEIQFLLSHIRRTRPGEYNFLEFLYRSIHTGANTPQKLSPLIEDYFDGHGYSQAQVNTMQTGGIARLIEMRFVKIEKKGIYTTYIAEAHPSRIKELATTTSGNEATAVGMENGG